MEDFIRVRETQCEIIPSTDNRAKLHKVVTELKRWLKIEEEIWKQKAIIR